MKLRRASLPLSLMPQLGVGISHARGTCIGQGAVAADVATAAVGGAGVLRAELGKSGGFQIVPGCHRQRKSQQKEDRVQGIQLVEAAISICARMNVMSI